jgi:hypothetical protein
VRRRAGRLDTASVEHFAATDCPIANGDAIDDGDMHACNVGLPDILHQRLAPPIADRGLDPDAAAESQADGQTDPESDVSADTQANSEADARTAVAQPARQSRVTHRS